jgi:hypothetical protein
MKPSARSLANPFRRQLRCHPSRKPNATVALSSQHLGHRMRSMVRQSQAIGRFLLSKTGVFLFALCGISTALAQTNPVPLINQPLLPDTTAPGSPAFTLTVNGVGFVPGAQVNWNGSAHATTFLSSSQLTAAILASDVATASTATVTVNNPGVPSSNAVFFPIGPRAFSFPTEELVFSTGGEPNDGNGDIVVGDFNRDGKLDIAVAAGKSVSVLLGNGDGTFQTHVDYPTASATVALTTADFNGDGILDLAASNGGDVSIFLGKGDGTFGPRADFAAILGTAIAAGDFNGDGKLDLALAGIAYGHVPNFVVMLGNGDGTFQALPAYHGSLTYNQIVLGDFNRDGKLDLAAAGSGSYSIFLGNGDGTFTIYSSTPEVCLNGVTTADFNGDGILDLALTSGCEFNIGNVAILFGRGDGRFKHQKQYTTLGFDPIQIAIGDFNNDGNLDLFAADPQFNVSVFLGNGDGTFQKAHGVPLGVGFPYLTVGDFNNDGKLDLAFSQTKAGAHTVAVTLRK